MSLVVGDYVTPHRVSTDYTLGTQPQPTRFGVVDAVGGGNNRTVLWDDGQLEANIDEDALDECVVASTEAMVGKVVELDVNPTAALQPSSSYDATVIAALRRDPAGDGSPSDNRILCKLLNADVYYETLASNASQLDNR